MPELPEVETIKSQLKKIFPCKVQASWRSDVVGSILKQEDFSLNALELKKLKRHGKWLLFETTKGLLASHLGMTGGWVLSKEKIERKHTHLQFKIEVLKSKKIYYLGYVDPRRFGYMYFYNSKNTEIFIKKLGVDVSGNDFTLEHLLKLQERFPNKVLKPFLLDQKYFAGVGNYIASEICARAKLLPDRVFSSLSQKDLENIITSTDSVLSVAIKNKGNTFAGGYMDTTGNKGEALSNLVVFHQDKCAMCKQPSIKKITQAQRSTYYCENCQH